jgi:Zn-dependent protease
VETIIQNIAIYAIPVLLAITLHEAAHGYVARMFGDPTAYLLGRVTLNPLKHIDPFGTIVLPLIILLTSRALGGPGFVFGYAKPVPVNFGGLRKPKRDMIWVAAAGPASNLAQAIAWAILFKLLRLTGVSEDFFFRVCQAGIIVNIGLMAFNLLPLPPLDGGRVLMGVLPHGPAMALARLEPYGMWIIIGLLVLENSGVRILSTLLAPFYYFGSAIIGLIA